MSSFLCLLFCITLFISFSFGEKVTNLPGQPPVSFDQYSGYIVLNKTTNKSLFYWFQESQNDPKTDPIALWTNGGPGCSGLAGALIEQGAFRIAQNESLTINPGSWNQIASMLYIEQPIGVGFSYSDDAEDYLANDESAARDMYNMILGFLAEFPQYESNDFYITSESYGGHYMPTTAKYIVDNNKDNKINFKGFMVGNPFTSPTENRIGEYGTYYGHQMLPQPLWLEWQKKCYDDSVPHPDCPILELEMQDKIGRLVYPYGIDWPVCLNDDDNFIQKQWFLRKIVNETLKRPIPDRYFKDDMDDDDERRRRRRRLLQFDACAVDYMKTYLNRNDVQSALHTKPNTRWRMCGGPLYNYADGLIPMMPTYDYLCKGNYNLKITVYSGDDDTVCGTAGTQFWMNNMGWNITSDGNWKEWILNGQNGGYKMKWNCGNMNISLVTVHSAGHEVPWYKQQKALHVFKQYIKGEYA